MTNPPEILDHDRAEVSTEGRLAGGQEMLGSIPGRSTEEDWRSGIALASKAKVREILRGFESSILRPLDIQNSLPYDRVLKERTEC